MGNSKRENDENTIVDLLNRLSEYATDENSTKEAVEGILSKIRAETSRQIEENKIVVPEQEDVKKTTYPNAETAELISNELQRGNADIIRELMNGRTNAAGEEEGSHCHCNHPGDFIFTRTREVKAPGKAHDTDAGIDFYVPDAKAWDSEFRKMVINYSRNPTDELMEIRDDNPASNPYIVVKPGGHVAIPSGVKTIIPRGYGMMFVNKSGVATKMKLDHSACLVDSAYRDEVVMCFFNNGAEDATITPGMKITQGLIVPVVNSSIIEVLNCVYDDLGKNEDRGGGFGSSGVN